MSDPMIEKYKRELLEFSRRYPKFTAPVMQPEPEPEAVPVAAAPEPETMPEPAERLVSAEHLYREDFVQTAPAVTASMRLQNVAQHEQMPPEPQETPQRETARQEQAAAVMERHEKEMEYAACDATDPPYCNGTVDTFATREAFMEANPGYGYLRVQTSVAEQAYPVQNATVEISKTFSGQKNVFFTAQTDASGIVSRVTLPAPDRDLSSSPSALQPYATYDIYVSHPDFTDVYVPNCIVFATIETIQQVRMVPLASCEEEPEQPFCEEV